ncbi:hypothetical protein [Acidovorax sp. Root219]|uniref:hypothetical protein n=1 Tax=Acidovorax sp. Root219 TaxID=1736493 RepID=UPI000A556757|nr:hypothetical protein [Acidovorax sp. Root219]
MLPLTTTPLPFPAGHAAGPLSRHPHGFLAMAGLALALVLASPAPCWAQQAAAPAAKAAPKLTQSYHDRVEELQDQVNEGKLAEIRARIVPTTERKVFDVDDVNDSQTWWQYEDDTTFVHIENGTGRTITGLVLDFWVDSCSQKAKPPNTVHVLLKKPLRKNAQAVVVVPPSKLLHTKNEVSCLSVRGGW